MFRQMKRFPILNRIRFNSAQSTGSTEPTFGQLYLGMPQDSSFEWKSESQFKFLDENPCTHAVLGALCDTIRFFWIQCHLVTKLKG